MSRRHEVGVGCLLLAALAATAVLALQLGRGPGLRDSLDVSVPADDAAGLQAGAVVAVAGVEVGKVQALELDGGRARVHLALDPDAALRTGTRARIRPQSLLGTKYVELAPGPPDAALLADGDVLAPMPPQVEIDELVEVVGPLVGALDPDVVRRVATALSDALREDPERVARMLVDLERVLANAADTSEQLPELARETRGALAAARATLSSVDQRAREARDTIARADRVLARLEAAAEPLPETVAEARAAVADARATLAKIDAAATDLDAVLDNLSAFDREEVERLLRDEGIRVRLAGRREKR